MGVIVTNVKISKNPVNIGEIFKIQVAVKETLTEPKNYRFPITLGKPKGNLSKI